MKTTSLIFRFGAFLTVFVGCLVGTGNKTAAQKLDLIVQTGHTSSVQAIDFRRSGETLASGDNDGYIKLWDVKSRSELKTLQQNGASVFALKFSLDGEFLASGSADPVIKLWSVKTGKVVKLFTGHSGKVTALCFAGNGKTLISGGEDHRIILWDVETASQISAFKEHSSLVTSLAISPDEQFLLSGSYDATVKLWNLQTKSLVRTFPHPTVVTSVSFINDRKEFVSGGEDNKIRFWDVESGLNTKTLPGHSDYVTAIAFDQTGKVLASGSRDKSVKLWNLQTAREIEIAPAHSYYVTAVAFDPNGTILASAGTDRLIKLWDVESGKPIGIMGGVSSAINSASVSLDKTVLATSSRDKFIRLWDLNKGREINALKACSDSVFDAFLSPVANTVAGICGNFISVNDKTIQLFDVGSSAILTSISGYADWKSPVVFAPDGNLLAAGGTDKTIKLWKAQTGALARTFKGHEQAAVSFTFNKDGKILASGSTDKTVKLWNTATGEEIKMLEGHLSTITSLAFSPNEKFLASGSYDGTIMVWDMNTKTSFRTLKTDNSVRKIAIDGDEQLLAALSKSNSDQRNIKLWNIADGKELSLPSRLPKWINFEDEGFVSMPKFDLIFVRDGDRINLVNAETGKKLASLIALNESDWAVVAPDGRFDTNLPLEDIAGLHWIDAADPLRPLPLEIFMRDYYEPQLLRRILQGEEFKALPNLSGLNRRQPKVEINDVSVPDANRRVTVSISVDPADNDSGAEKTAPPDCLKTPDKCVYDLRLFRDGQLVGSLPNDAPERLSALPAALDFDRERQEWRKVSAITSQAGECRFEKPSNRFQCQLIVQLPLTRDVAEVELTAYAFNDHRVKSQTAKWNRQSWEKKLTSGESNKLPKAETVKKRAYVIGFGVNKFEQASLDLDFSAKDAEDWQMLLEKHLRTSQEYEVVPVALTTKTRDTNGKPEGNATREKLKALMGLLAGKERGAANVVNEVREMIKKQGKELRAATPDDVVFVMISTHGYTDARTKEFYLLPSNTGNWAGDGITPEAVEKFIKGEELGQWLREIDAGEMVLVVDACYSSSAVESGAFKAGPLGNRGFGQLAYDKRMRVLAAARNEAKEVSKLSQSLLTHVLLKEGLEEGQADYKKTDGQIFSKEWLEFAEKRVPEKYETLFKTKGIPSGVDEPEEAQVQYPVLFDFRRKETGILLRRLAR